MPPTPKVIKLPWKLSSTARFQSTAVPIDALSRSSVHCVETRSADPVTLALLDEHISELRIEVNCRWIVKSLKSYVETDSTVNQSIPKPPLVLTTPLRSRVDCETNCDSSPLVIAN